MHCPYCGKQVSDNARVCGYCGSQLAVAIPPPAPPPPPYQPPPPMQPPRVIVQRSAEGPLSILAGLLNFALSALVIGLIVGVVLVLLCVVRLPSKFPVLDLPPQLDTLWSRAVSMQNQVCHDNGGSAPAVAPPAVNPPAEKKPSQPKPKQPDPEPVCSSGLGEADCKAAGGNPTMMCDMKEGCHTICFCNK